jgi:uroporphyrinogen decarboxylase
MTPKEQWLQFYQHKYNDGTTFPNLAGLHIVGSDFTGINEKPHVGIDAGKDWFGCEWVKDTSIKVNIPDPRVKFILEDVSDWREVVQWPDLDAYDFETAARNSGVDQVDREQKLIYFTLVMGPWERLHALMGFEEALMALISDPEECDAFFTAFMDWRCKLLEKIKEYYNPDVIMYHDDIGTQLDMFFSPELWRRLMKPHLKRATDKVHELGMFMEYHSCGKLEQVVPDLVEIGVDAWQGQEINDIRALKELTAGKLEYHPLLDYATMVTKYNAGTATMDDVRAFVRESIEKNMVGGHYSPLMQPFGDPVTVVMTQEFAKIYMGQVGDPA